MNAMNDCRLFTIDLMIMVVDVVNVGNKDGPLNRDVARFVLAVGSGIKPSTCWKICRWL